MATPQREQHEGVRVDGIGHHVTDGGGMLARVGVVRARAARYQVARHRKQFHPVGSGVVDDARYELVVEQRRGMASPGRQGIEETLLGARAILLALIGCVLGSILYRIAIQLALSSDVLGLQASDLNFVTAFLVTIALILPRLRRGGAA